VARAYETRCVIHAMVERTVQRYLSQVDQFVPGVITGFYVVGSVALGAYREDRSDVDFVAVVGRELGPRERAVRGNLGGYSFRPILQAWQRPLNPWTVRRPRGQSGHDSSSPSPRQLTCRHVAELRL
jgi:hypothetical protein